MSTKNNRRELLSAGTAALAYWLAPSCQLNTSSQPQSPNEQIGVGCIGMRYQGSVIAHKSAMYGKIIGVCDVDKNVRDQAKASFGSTPVAVEDYHDLLKRKDIDVITIGAPDHWHTQMVIDACRAGKDVYCEKPLTLTIDEGKLLCKVVEETGRVVQVGSWQRSDFRFRQAVEMVKQGRIGKLQKVEVVLGKNVTGGPFESRKVPRNFNWNLWQGQTPYAEYVPERTHYTFRWWREYSGGTMTDWGAHHIDIAQWAIGDYPVEIEGTSEWPSVNGGYNVPTKYSVKFRYGNGVVMTVADRGRNGIMFTGEKGRIFVNRGTLSGKPVEELSAQPLKRQDWIAYGNDNLERPKRVGKLESIVNHMGNFFDCVRDRSTPISDVLSQHRSVSSCHLANLSMQLNRKLNWDPNRQDFGGDVEANALLTREQRKGFEVG